MQNHRYGIGQWRRGGLMILVRFLPPHRDIKDSIVAWVEGNNEQCYCCAHLHFAAWQLHDERKQWRDSFQRSKLSSSDDGFFCCFAILISILLFFIKFAYFCVSPGSEHATTAHASFLMPAKLSQNISHCANVARLIFAMSSRRIACCVALRIRQKCRHTQWKSVAIKRFFHTQSRWYSHVTHCPLFRSSRSCIAPLFYLLCTACDDTNEFGARRTCEDTNCTELN